MRERVLHALDLGMLGDWEGAKRSLENLDDPIVPRLTALMTEQQRRDRDRTHAQALARHELGNALSIAQANVEAMIDGILDPTPERLTGIRDALQTCGALLEDLKREFQPPKASRADCDMFNLSELLAAQITFMTNIAESKNVRLLYDGGQLNASAAATYRGDRERTAQLVRNLLLSAVRYTPPGGAISIDRLRPNGQIDFSVRNIPDGTSSDPGFSVVSKLLEALGEDARVTSLSPAENRFTIQLPAAA